VSLKEYFTMSLTAIYILFGLLVVKKCGNLFFFENEHFEVNEKKAPYQQVSIYSFAVFFFTTKLMKFVLGVF
jgi:hypothetical protein